MYMSCDWYKYSPICTMHTYMSVGISDTNTIFNAPVQSGDQNLLGG